jgi:2-furoyl-CoA dehydrogenase large subunit
LRWNIVNRRSFRYGDPDKAFSEADRVFDLSYSYPRYASTPMETFGVIAHFERAPDRFTVWSNFQGPFVIQPLMAGALRVPGNKLRLITPPSSGGSFGIKQAILSYIILLAAVSRQDRAAGQVDRGSRRASAAAASSDQRFPRHSATVSSSACASRIRSPGAYIRAPGRRRWPHVRRLERLL